MFRDFLNKEIYFMEGDDTRTWCEWPFHPKEPFYYPAPFIEAVHECGFNYFMWPDGKGFALNFKKIEGVHAIGKCKKENNRTYVTVPTADVDWDYYRRETLENLFPEAEGTCIVFRGHPQEKMALFLPVPVPIIRDMVFRSFDFRAEMLADAFIRKIVPPRKPADLKL